jgi:hypothetical protein
VLDRGANVKEVFEDVGAIELDIVVAVITTEPLLIVTAAGLDELAVIIAGLVEVALVLGGGV